MIEQDERNFCLSLAGHSFAIHALYSEVYDLCKKYLTTDPADADINITEDDIDLERVESNKQGLNPSNAYLETLAVYRKISEKILDYDVFLMHGAVVAYEENAYMFTAASGTGKTTHIKKWLENLPNAYIVNGDKPLIQIAENVAIAYGTPWCGKEKMETNCMVPLKAIVLMERGENNEIHEVPFGQAFTLLLKQAYMPKNAELMKKTLELLASLKGKVRIYKFVFNNMKEDAFSVSYNALTESDL